MAEDAKHAPTRRPVFQWTVSAIILLVLAVTLMPVIYPGSRFGPRAPAILQEGRCIGLAMFQYAEDHHGAYPNGKSSTEILQKLIDEGYLADPSFFSYCEALKIPGKVPPTSKILKPENVCWDITAGLDVNSPEAVPLVFSTGYKIDYAPAGNAVPLFKPADRWVPGIAIVYNSMSVCFLPSDNRADGIVNNVISPSFVPVGKTYRQLTPDGPLSP